MIIVFYFIKVSVKPRPLGREGCQDNAYVMRQLDKKINYLGDLSFKTEDVKDCLI